MACLLPVKAMAAMTKMPMMTVEVCRNWLAVRTM